MPNYNFSLVPSPANSFQYSHIITWLWILVGNYISVTIALGLIGLHTPSLKKSHVWLGRARHHTFNDNHWHRLWEIRAIIAVKTNNATNYICTFFENMFYCSRNRFIEFKHANVKGVRQCVTNAASLDDGNCEVTIPIVKGHHVM